MLHQNLTQGLWPQQTLLGSSKNLILTNHRTTEEDMNGDLNPQEEAIAAYTGVNLKGNFELCKSSRSSQQTAERKNLVQVNNLFNWVVWWLGCVCEEEWQELL
jgi:hypothetical protein